MFTKEQILEIQKKLEAAGMKDSQFPVAASISGSEEFPILQDAQNKRLKLETLTNYISSVIVPLIQEIIDTAVSELEGYMDNKTETVLNSINSVTEQLVSMSETLDSLVESADEEVTLTVETNVSEAVIMINGKESSTVTVKKGEVVSILVTADGYLPFSEVVDVNRTQTLNIVLTKGSYTPPQPSTVTFSINPEPSDATVKIDGVERKTISVESGTEVAWEVSRDGYETKSGQYTVTSDYVMDVTLEMLCTVTVTAEPGDAKILIGGELRNTMTATEGTMVEIVVSKEGYKDSRQDYTFSKPDDTVHVVLELLPPTEVTLTVIPTPSSATVFLDSEERKAITVSPGTTVNVEVSAPGYDTYNELHQVNSDETLRITLDERTETSWSDLVLSQAEGSSNIKAVPSSGGEISLSAQVTVNYSNGETETRDVTSQIGWEVNGEGCTSDGGGSFTWASNPGTSQRSATITASIEEPGGSNLESSIQTIQIGSEEYVTLNPDTLNYSASGGSKNIQVSSNTSWSLE